MAKQNVGKKWKTEKGTVRKPEGCLSFFCAVLVQNLDLGSMGFGFGGSGFLAVSSFVTSSTTIKTEIIVETALSFVCSKLTILAKLVSDSGYGGRQICGLLLVTVIACGATRLGLGGVIGACIVRGVSGFIVRLLEGFVVGFQGGRFAVKARAGFFTESFPITGINGVG